MTRVEDTAFTCSMCLDIFTDPMECENCHNNYCKKCCKQIKKCPLCMIEPLKVRENVTLKRILMDLKFICPNNCGGSFTKSDIDNHIKECQLPLLYCSICLFQGNKDKFWLHITENHKEEIITSFAKQSPNAFITNNSNQQPLSQLAIEKNAYPMEKSLPYPSQQISSINDIKQINRTQTIPQSNYNNNTRINDPNYPSINDISDKETQKYFLGSNGIYYCYQPSNLNCGCCNGVCAEGNCLCKHCMNLNMKIKRLNKGDLINKAGKVSRYSMNFYYCGEKYLDQKKNVVGFVFQQEVFCNYPHDPCPNCQSLNSILKKYL